MSHYTKGQKGMAGKKRLGVAMAVMVMALTACAGSSSAHAHVAHVPYTPPGFFTPPGPLDTNVFGR